jgi:hypothetical protein
MDDKQEQGAAQPRAVGSVMFWRVFAMINVITVGYVLWVIWQLSPKPVVNDFVMRMPVSQRTALGAISPGPVQDRAAPQFQGGIPAPPGEGVTVTPVVPPARLQEIPIQSGEPMGSLRMDTQIRMPARAASPAPPGK